MHVLTLGNTVYTHPVAKVMISISDDLLSRLDQLAKKRGQTRSGLLQALAERELEYFEDEERAEIRRLVELATGPLGGNATQLIREDRDSR
jgi:metal-responsive CopG/Arc/MetJ family transcriptional regulator